MIGLLALMSLPKGEKVLDHAQLPPLACFAAQLTPVLREKSGDGGSMWCLVAVCQV